MDSQTDQRSKELFDLGMKYNGSEFFMDVGTKGYAECHWTEMTCDTDEEWAKRIQDIKNYIEKMKDS